MKPIMRVYKEKFLEWYFDSDDYTNAIIVKLKGCGKYTITLKDVWKSAGYISADKVANWNELQLPEDTYEIEEPSVDYNVEWI